MIGGAGFFLRSVTYILAPSLSSPFLLMPMALAGIPLTFWLLFRGVTVEAISRPAVLDVKSKEHGPIQMEP